MTTRPDRSYTQGPAEHQWACPRCDLVVLATDWPPPSCPAHPFDEMVDAGLNGETR